MGVYQRYRDKNGRPAGPWFAKYPYRRDPRTGKIVCRTKKASHSKKLAEKFLKRKEDEFFRRDEQGLAIEDPKPKITFAELIDWYLEQDLVGAKRSYKSDVQRADVLRRRFGRMIAEEMTRNQVRNYQVRRMKERTWRGDKVSPATVNREVALMRAVYNLGMDEGLVSESPCRKIKMLKENNARDRVLKPEEFERLCSELTPVAKRIVMTAYHTGMCHAEILGLTVEKVNLGERYIDLDADETKDHERRRVYFGEDLFKVLKECLDLRDKVGATHDYVFTRESGEPVRCIRVAFEGACKRANLGDFHFHDLRHCYNTEMRRAGVHDSVIMKQTGHATTKMFLRYNTVDEGDGREAVRRREEYLRRQNSDCSLCAPEGETEISSSVST